MLTRHRVDSLYDFLLLALVALAGLFLGSRWLGQSRCLADCELLWQLVNSCEPPVNRDSAGVGQHKLLLWLVTDKSSLKLDDLLVDRNNGLGTEALDVKHCWVGVILQQTNDLILVLLRLIREGVHLQVECLIDLQGSLSRLDDEWGLLSWATFLSWEGRLQNEGSIEVIFSIVGDLEESAIDALELLFVAAFSILTDQEWSKIEDAFADDECLREEAFGLGSWPCLLVLEIKIPELRVDRWEVA